MADPKNLKDLARDEINKAQRDMAADAESTADAADRAANSFDSLNQSVSAAANSLEDLYEQTLSAIPKKIDESTSSVDLFQVGFDKAAAKAKEFDQTIDSAIPSIKELAGVISTDLPTEFGKFADTFDIDELNKKITKFDKAMQLVNKQLDKEVLAFKKIFAPSTLTASEKQRISVDKQAKSAKELSDKIADAAKNTDKYNKTAMQAVAAGATGNALGNMMNGHDPIAEIAQTVKKYFFQAWDYIDNFVLPIQADLNKSLGGTNTALHGIGSQAMGMGHTFASLGLSFAEGAKHVSTIAQQLSNFNLPKSTVTELVKVAEVTGAGAENAGKLGNQFIFADGNIKNMTAAMEDATRAANEYNVPVREIQRDMAENIDLVSRFGTANYQAFNTAAAKARRYGLTIKEVNSAFGDQMDTFDSVNNMAAKLNGTFGTTINSLELLQEQDVSKRMEMVAKSLNDAGIQFNSLDRASQNTIKQLTGLDQAQAALAFSGEEGRKKFEAQAKAQGIAAKASQDWERALGSMRRVLVNTQEEFGKLLMAVWKVVARVFGFKDALGGASSIANTFKDILHQITERIDKFADTIPKGGIDILATFSKLATSAQTAASAIDSISKTLERLTGKRTMTDDLVDTFMDLSKATDLSAENIEKMEDHISALKAAPGLQEEYYQKLKSRGINKDAAKNMMEHYDTQVLTNKLRQKGVLEGSVGTINTQSERDINITIQQTGDQVRVKRAMMQAAAGNKGPKGRTLRANAPADPGKP